MTTLYAVDGQARGRDEETLTEAVARRLREQLGGRRISQRALARELGETPTWVNSRALGRISMSMADIEAIANATGISAVYLMTGVDAEGRRPTMSDDGHLVHPPGLEPGTHWLSAEVTPLPVTGCAASAPERDTPADVIALPSAQPATPNEVLA